MMERVNHDQALLGTGLLLLVGAVMVGVEVVPRGGTIPINTMGCRMSGILIYYYYLSPSRPARRSLFCCW